jgi:hypothetical protein
VGSVLLGIHTADGLGFVLPPLPLDDDFIRAAERADSTPEARFRFSEPCVERGCKQWTGSACGVVQRVLAAEAPREDLDLPACGIRQRCRWFAQEGPPACMVCPLIRTDNAGALAPLEFSV